ncbi:delta-6-desaturase [Hesseltinella vesiculosa]|uniref:Delta-6-desaturase n=1 Tax=Hesseltinella vesiculosa TaxID=101127 RepID=A0A1X2G6G4_9FUNG|nr:delta-6-desaturase [Hesseltinella vesiculosa]
MSGQSVIPLSVVTDSLKAYKAGEKDAKKFIVVDNKVYEITDFIADHPGGVKVISTQIGKDASDVFHAMHPESAYEMLANCYVGDLGPEDAAVPELDEKAENSKRFGAEVRALRQQLEEQGAFQGSHLFYAYKVLSTLAIGATGLAMLYFGGQSTWVVLAAALVTGVFWQQCGWLAHDFGHHQAYNDHSANDVMVAFLGGFCQGFSLSWWKNKHNTHHASTNVHGHDPDIDTAPVLLWDEMATATFYGSLEDQKDSTFSRFIAEHILPYQTRYYFFVIGFARLSWAIQSLQYSFSVGALNKSPSLNLLERSMLVCHWVLYTSWTLLFISSWTNMLMFFVVSQATTGYALALVFAMNHSGMPVLTQEQAEKMEFFEIQCVTARDVSMGPLGDWFFGGLNYQIEHHVFPDMPRHNLPKVKPQIKALCKKYDILYHDTSCLRGTLEVLQALDVVQKLAGKLSQKMF